jgi:pimeloyl-ACP methyl ester carboxylesterase
MIPQDNIALGARPAGSALDRLREAGVDMLTQGGNYRSLDAVFLHGIGGRASSFLPVFAAWAKPARLIAWDAPGYGGSDLLADDAPSPGDYGRRLAEALASHVGAPLHVVGQSLGALFAAAFALAHPERVCTLTLVCPAHGYGQPRGQLTEALTQRLADVAAQGSQDFAATRAHRLVHDPERKPEVVAAIREAMGSISEAGHRAAVHALAQGDLAADCARLTCPVHVLAGADDVITPLAGSLRLFDVLRTRPRGPAVAERLTVIGDAGHGLLQEHPAAVASALESFMEQRR